MEYEVLQIQDIKSNFDAYKNQTVRIDGYLSGLELTEKKDKTKYLKCILGDSTGTLTAKLWDESQSLSIVNELASNSRKSAAVSVIVTIKDWQGSPDLAIEAYQLNLEKPLLGMIEKSKDDPKRLADRMKQLIEMVQHEGYRKLLDGIFNPKFSYRNEEIKTRMEKIRKDFYYSAAATGHHHNYLHGLIEHTVKVVETALFLAKNYQDIYQIDVDLLVTGGILHDVGKIYEYSYEEGVEYSEEGSYVYHTTSGSVLIAELNSDLEIHMPRQELAKLWHLITSHHGEYAEHSPNQFCPEAHLLSFADLVDSRTNKVMRDAASNQLRKMKTRYL